MRKWLCKNLGLHTNRGIFGEFPKGYNRCRYCGKRY